MSQNARSYLDNDGRGGGGDFLANQIGHDTARREYLIATGYRERAVTTTWTHPLVGLAATVWKDETKERTQSVSNIFGPADCRYFGWLRPKKITVVSYFARFRISIRWSHLEIGVFRPVLDRLSLLRAL